MRLVRKTLSAVLAAPVLLLSLTASADDLAARKAYVMAVDPSADYVATALKPPILLIPATVATTVSDNATERELVAGWVRSNFLWTGKAGLFSDPRWFEFKYLITGKTYRFFKDDTFIAVFSDLSSVEFRFIGTAVGCPSGLCFEWVVGTEKGGRRERRTHSGTTRMGEHPGKERGDHGGPTSMVYFRAMKPYDPYDPNNWAGTARPW